MNDRAQDNWEPLLAIADHAGGDWPQLARRAALKLSGAKQDAVSLSAELLADIREVFEAKEVDRLTTADLLKALTDDDLKPWVTYNRGKPMSPRQLAKRLEDYRVSSKNIKLGYADVKKGFERTQFSDAFVRYLPPSGIPENIRYPLPSSVHEGLEVAATKVDPLQPATRYHGTERQQVADKGHGSAIENQSATRKIAPILESSGVAHKAGVLGGDVLEVEI